MWNTQSTAALQGLLLATFISHARVLGSWALSAADMAVLAQKVVPQVGSLLIFMLWLLILGQSCCDVLPAGCRWNRWASHNL